MDLLQLIAIIILAFLPVLAWSYILLAKSDESRALITKVFIFGGFSTIPLLAYRYLWTYFPDLNFIKTISEATAGKFVTVGSFVMVPVSFILIFMTIGVLEELLKALVVRFVVPKKEINYIADAVEFSIAAALGFAFVENIFYLAEIYYVIGSSALIKMFVSRALFATFAHTLFSGLFGYFYGVSVFVGKNIDEWKGTFDMALVHKIRKPWFKTSLFRIEEFVIGIAYAGLLHAFYNIFLELKFTTFLIPFIVFGYIFLRKLISIERKEVEG